MNRSVTLSGAVLLAALLSLASCSHASSSNVGESAAKETRVITDIEGTKVTVPAHPTRVVTLSEPTLDGMLALGLKPVGAISGRGQRDYSNYLKPLTSGIKLMGGVGQPNFEAIGAAKPDLILVDGTSVNNNPPVIAALRQIAPVVYTGYAGGPWEKNFRLTADALNMSAKGEEVIANYKKHVDEVKAKLGKFKNDTFSVVRWQGNSAATILKELPAGLALTDLGLKRPPSQDHRGRGHSNPVSLENLQSIDADWIFFGTLGGSSVSNPDAGGTTDIEGGEKALREAESVPGFKDLKAFKEHHIIVVDGGVWTSTGGPLLMNRIVSDVDHFAQTH